MEKTKINICDTCLNKYPNCVSGIRFDENTDFKFGNGVGNDNIYECIYYNEIMQEYCEHCGTEVDADGFGIKDECQWCKAD